MIAEHTYTIEMLLPLLFIIFLLLLFLFLLHIYRSNTTTSLPPGPPGLPFLGNLHQLDNSTTHLYLSKLSKQYGPLMSLRLGFVPTIVVSSAKMAKQILYTHEVAFADRPSLLAQQLMSYNGLDLAFSRYDTYNKEIRKVCVSQLFSVRRVQAFRFVREQEVSRLIANIATSCPKVVNLSETVRALATTIVCRVAFGKNYEDEGLERSRFHGLLNETQAMMGSFFVSDYFPVIGYWVDWLSGLIGRMENNFEEFDAFYQEIIEEHLDPKRPKPEQEDFIDVLLGLHNDHRSSNHLTLDHIKAILMDIFIGATDASAATMVSAMTALVKNSRVMKKVQEEIRSMIGKELGFVNEDDLQKLPYLKAVVKETMRVQPPIPIFPREAIQKCTINGYVIKPKTLVYVNAWAIGRDPKAWENPEEFWPERFLTNSIDFKGQDFELIPFGAGRRGCPGVLMGATTVELALANLLYAFDWELPPGIKKEDINTDVIPGITMHKKDALCLVAKNFI